MEKTWNWKTNESFIHKWTIHLLIMKKLIKFDDGNALFSNAIDTQNYKELEVYKMLHSLLNIFVPIRTLIMIFGVISYDEKSSKI